MTQPTEEKLQTIKGTEHAKSMFIGKTIKDFKIVENSHGVWIKMTFEFTDGTESIISATSQTY